jgi:choline transport protein
MSRVGLAKVDTSPQAVIATGLGAIPLGSSTAFLDLTGSFIILSTISYAIPFVANVITKRRHFPVGPFNMGKLGTPVNIFAVLCIAVFDIFYCFRKSEFTPK